MAQVSIVIKTLGELKKRVKEEIRVNGVYCDLNHLDVSNFVRLTSLFEDIDFQGNISKWNVSNLQYARNLFTNSTFNGDISEWNVSTLEDATGMFSNSAFNSDISQWNVGRLYRATHMFSGSAFNQDLSTWPVDSLCFAESMFERSAYTGDLSRWNVRGLKTATRMFAHSAFNGDLSNWEMLNASRVNMCEMFEGACFSGDLSRWTLDGQGRFDQMLDASFTGIAPGPLEPPSREFYASIFGNDKSLSTYLRKNAFNSVHFNICQVATRKPASVSVDDFRWAKQQKTLGLAMGFDTQELSSAAMQAYCVRKHAKATGLTPVNKSASEAIDIGAIFDL